MSAKIKNKEVRASKRAEREEKQARRVIQWIVIFLVILFLMIMIGSLYV